jgi:DNA-binding MarR family transcriptional regulator
MQQTKSDPNYPLWPLAERPGFLARRLYQIHVALFSEACAQFDVTPVQYSLLTALSLRIRADQTTLAADVALDRTTVTGALKRLEKRGLIQRSTSQQDRRSQECRLTSAGAGLLVEMEEPARWAHRETIAPLSTAEQAILVELMGRLVAFHASVPAQATPAST